MTMLGGFNQEELLGLIEGDLPEAQAAAIRARLAEVPGALDLIDTMRHDRAILSNEPMPALPKDFVAELEPLIARAMLLGDVGGRSSPVLSPAAFRARHRRPVWHRAVRYSLAAAVVLAVGGGAMVVSQSILSGGAASPDAGELALAPEARMNDRDRGIDSADRERLATIHHYDALESHRVVDERLALNDAGAPAAPRLALASGASAVESGFALDLRGPQRDSAMARVVSTVDSLQTAAFVRNFTLEELTRQWNEHAVAADDERRARERLTRLAADGRREVRLSPRDERAINHAARGRGVQLGEHLAGHRSFEPPAVHQFTWQSRGASHSLTMPARALPEFLAQLHEEFGSAVSIGPITAENDVDAVESPSPPADLWQQWQRWNEAISALTFTRDADDRLMVILPVLVD